MLCSLSNLKVQDLAQIRSLETDLGKTLLAFYCHDLSPATLESEKLGRIQTGQIDPQIVAARKMETALQEIPHPNPGDLLATRGSADILFRLWEGPHSSSALTPRCAETTSITA